MSLFIIKKRIVIISLIHTVYCIIATTELLILKSYYNITWIFTMSIYDVYKVNKTLITWKKNGYMKKLP
jgi:hypothetical protein